LLFSVFLVWLVLCAGCTRSSAAGPVNCPDYKVGIVLATNSAEGVEQRSGYDYAISSSRIRGCQVTVIYQDEGGPTDRETAQTGALDLFDQGVVAIIGGTSDQASMRVAGVVPYLKLPLIVPLEVNDTLAQETNSWVFRISPTQSAMYDRTFEMLATQLGKQSKVAILFEKTDYGESAAVIAGQAALARGLQIVAYLGYPTTALDKTSLQRDLIDGAPNALLIISSNTAQAQDLFAYFKPMPGLVYLLGSGYGFTGEQFIYTLTGALNPGLDGLILSTVWNLDLPWAGIPEFERDFFQFQQARGDNDNDPPTIRHVQAFTALRLLIDVMGSLPADSSPQTDLVGYRQALADGLSNLSGDHQMISIMGGITFDPSGQSSISPLLVQITGSGLVTIYPPDYAGENTIQPLP
jgi:ABC-type branched-subunit amino acid transport system substrate-binding protein